MKWMRDNWGLKLLSLVLAVLMWLVVINVSKPEISDYRSVDLDIINQEVFEADSKVWDIDRTTVTVNYTVRTDQRANIAARDFHVYVDLEDYSITGSVPIYVEVLNDKEDLISNVTVRPTVAHVTLEDVQEKQFALTVRQNGMPMDGYSVANLIISPETVYVTGPESSVGRISEVGVNVNVDNLSESSSGTAVPVFYDANHNVISGLGDVKLSVSNVNYSVTIHKKKSINLLSSIRGVPAAGYQYESMTVSPASIQLSAAASVIDSLTVFEMPSVDISGATGSLTQTFQITDYLPAGVELAEPSGEVNVTVRIERIPETETTTAATDGTTTTEEAVHEGELEAESSPEETVETEGEETAPEPPAEAEHHEEEAPTGEEPREEENHELPG